MKNTLSIFVFLLIGLLTVSLGSFQINVQAQTLTVSQEEGHGSSQGFDRVAWEHSYEPQRGMRALKTIEINPDWPADRVKAETAKVQNKFEKTLRAVGADFRLLDNSTPRLLLLVKEGFTSNLTATLQYQVNGLSLDTVASLMTQSNLKVFNDVPQQNSREQARNIDTDDKIEPVPANTDLQNLQIATQARDQSGQEVIIFVIDGGLDTTNPVFFPYLKVDPKEILGDGIDNNDNGVVDEAFEGLNTVSADGPPSALNITSTHGSVVTAANIKYFELVAKLLNSNVKLSVVPLRVVGANGIATDQAIANAQLHAQLVMRNNPNAKFAFNVSLGGGGYNADLDVLFAKSFASNVFISIGAGNRFATGGMDLFTAKSYPACYAETAPIMVVGATDEARNRVNFSNFGNVVRVYALGVNVDCLIANGTGTSFSTPQATAVGAFLMAHYGYTSWQAIQILTLSADKAPALNGQVHDGGGILNPINAVTINYSSQVQLPVIVAPLKVTASKIKGQAGTNLPIKLAGMFNAQAKVKSTGFVFKIPEGSNLRQGPIFVTCPEGGTVAQFR